MRLALLLATPSLDAALAALADAFEENGRRFAHVRKLGRTQFQDAMPMTLGQEMQAYAVTIGEDLDRLRAARSPLHEVNLGGTAIGTGILACAAYHTIAMAELARLSGIALAPVVNLMEANWDMGVFFHLSGVLQRVATKLSKIANDLRLLASGPRRDLGEIRLPAVQPGSSIMPGKVNPVIPEAVKQVAFHVIGMDVAVTFAAGHGQLQLNAVEPVIAQSRPRATDLPSNAATDLCARCVVGIEADELACARHLEKSAAGLTLLVPFLDRIRPQASPRHCSLPACRCGKFLSQASDVRSEEVERALG